MSDKYERLEEMALTWQERADRLADLMQRERERDAARPITPGRAHERGCLFVETVGKHPCTCEDEAERLEENA